MDKQENRKTAVYVLVAGIAALVAWEPWEAAPPDESAPPAVGKTLFDKFKDPLAAKSLEILRFDQDTSTIRPFKVAQVDGVWSIPSHSNYPADAKEQMAEAATALMDLKIMSVESTVPGEQELYGVVAPDPQRDQQGMTGVGTRVTLKDAKDAVLADLVIGKSVKDQPTQRYVRVADQDPIYIVQIKTERLTTKFEDWIEEDLLKLNAFDVRDVTLSDYSIEEGVTADGRVGLQMNARSKTRLGYDDAKASWNLIELSEFDKEGKQVPTKLADDEELNSEKLNALKTALDDLQIIDVERKPKGLSQDLRASDDFVKDNEAGGSLLQKGFYPVPVKDHVEIFSSEGEATCATKDGVRYVLRFGRLTGDLGEGNESAEGAEAAEGEKPKSNPALNRYLFVMAQFDDSQIPKPELKPVPGGDKPAEDKPAEGAEAAPADGKPAAEAPKPDEGKPADGKSKSVPETKTAQNEQPAEATAAESKPAEGDAAKTEAAAQADAPQPGEPAKKAEAAPTAEELERVTIERENKRLQEEYDESVKRGQDKVKELNDRFADWYFIISDDVYKKVHLGRADIVKKKEVAQPENALDAIGTPDTKALEQGLKPE